MTAGEGEFQVAGTAQLKDCLPMSVHEGYITKQNGQ